MPDLGVIDLTLTEDTSSNSEDEDAPEEHVPVAHINIETRTKLHAAIDTIPLENLRKLVIKLANKHPDLEKELCEELLTVRRRTREIVQRWETCKNCEQEFDVNSKRKHDECRYHPGE